MCSPSAWNSLPRPSPPPSLPSTWQVSRPFLLALSKASFHSHPTLVFFLSPPFFIITYQNFPLLIIFFVYVPTWRVCPMSFLLVISSRRTECCQPCLPLCPWHLTQLLSSAGTQQTFSKWGNELDNNVLKVRNCAQSFLDPITPAQHTGSILQMLLRWIYSKIVKWSNVNSFCEYPLIASFL